MNPLYLLSEIISLSCQFVDTVEKLLCLSFYLMMSACPSSPMLYGSRMGPTILIVLTIYSGCHYSLQEHKSPPVQISTQKMFTCALMNPRKVQESENLVSES